VRGRQTLVARLCGGSSRPIESDGYYPTCGAGFHFVVKPEERMLRNLEYAHGNLNNYGIYLKAGYAW